MNLRKIFYLILAFYLPLLSQQNQETATPKEMSEPELIAIPITEITEKADQTYLDLQKLISKFEAPETFTPVEKDLPTLLDTLAKLQAKPVYKDLADQDLRILKNFHQEWNIYNSRLDEWKGILSALSQDVDSKSQQLKDLLSLWQLTKKEADKAKAPGAIKERITSTLKEITETDKLVTIRRNKLLVIQSNVSDRQNSINTLISDITEAENNLQGQLFVQDSPPLWNAVRAKGDSLHIASKFQLSWTELIRTNIAFINVNIFRFYFHLLMFVVLLLFTYLIYFRNKQKQLFDDSDKALKDSAYFISRPFSAALLIALFLSIWIYPETSVSVGELVLLLLLIPVLRLMPGIIVTELHRPMYYLAVLFVIEIMQKNAVGFVLLQRYLLLIVSVIAAVIIAWVIRPGGPIQKKEMTGVAKYLRRFAPVFLLLLLIAIFSNLYGAVSLANRLTWGVVEGSYILVTVYIAAKVASGLITVVIRKRRRKAMQFIKTYAYNLERWAKIVINAIAFYIWVRAAFRLFGLLEPFVRWYYAVLEMKWTVGSIVISIEAIFDFFMILIITFIVIRVIRIFLDMEIFPHLKLPKGLPSAINMMIRYVLVTLGIFFALSSLGIDLGKFGLLAGALGVGLGFGLQKIVANFISSLILAFGRAIRVGDTVQYNDVFGNVREIGVNACTVKTFDGSDAIIPNADLISNKVTNWTLSDMQRRMLLPVKVAFGNDPHEVLKILEKVAKDHPDVLENPESFSVFNGFGDNFLDFSLYYWIPTSAYFKAKTEVALGVHDAITAKGINTPRPQRDVYLAKDLDKEQNPRPVKKSPVKTTSRKKTSTDKG